MARGLILLVGVIAYVFFFLTFLYLIAFVGDFEAAPRTVDRGGPETGLAAALVVNVALIALFGVQHSVMARQGFKRGWTRIVPPAAERSVYVIAASATLWVLFHFWHPIPATLWRVDNALLAAVLDGLFWAGWLMVLVSTFLISHFELFGLKQVWLHLRGAQPEAPRFRQPFFYRLIRHPLYTGFFIAFWATPHMTVGHALLAAGIGIYALIAIVYEERDLVGLFGRDYEEYRARTGMLMPRLRARRASVPPPGSG